jgi:hypothetical protein
LLTARSKSAREKSLAVGQVTNCGENEAMPPDQTEAGLQVAFVKRTAAEHLRHSNTFPNSDTGAGLNRFALNKSGYCKRDLTVYDHSVNGKMTDILRGSGLFAGKER